MTFPIRLSALLLLLQVVITGCQNIPASSSLSGSLKEFNGQDVFLYSSKDRIGYKTWLKSLDTATVTQEGEFNFTFKCQEPDFFQVVGPNGYPLFEDVYLEPGDSMHILVPGHSDTTRTIYSGARAGAYTIHDLNDSLWNNDPVFKKDYHDIALMDIDSAWNFLQGKYNTRRSVINAHFRSHPEWETIRQKSLDAARYREAQEHYDYLYYHNYYTNDTFVYLIPDPVYYGFLDSIDLSHPPEYFSYDYMFFLSAFLRDQFHRDNIDLSDSVKYDRMLPLLVQAAKTHLTGEARDRAFLAIAGDFPLYLSATDFFEEVDSMDTYLASNYTSAENYDKFIFIKSEFDNLRPGSPAPPLALPDVNGDTVRLSDLRGKVLYIDFWGTWCYPCLKELPHSLELQEKFYADPVEFIYVGLQSNDDQLETWRQFILGEKSLDYAPFLEQRVYPGTHLLAEGQFNNPALKPFHIGAAPTYVLIDARGKLVSANAPRPSSIEIEGLIRETLSTVQNPDG